MGDILNLAGPRGLPLLGNAHQLQPDALHINLQSWAEEFGSMYRLSIGNKQTLIVSDPDLISEALQDRPTRFRRLMALEGITKEMGLNGLFSAEGADWQRQRRVWMKALSIHQLRPFFQQLTGVTRTLQTHWQKAAESGAAIDVQKDLLRYSVDITTLFAFGENANTLQNSEGRIQNHMGLIFQMINRRLTLPIPYWRWFSLPIDHQLNKALAAVRSYIEDIIDQTRARVAADPELAEQPSNLLEALIVSRDDDGSGFTDEEIYGNTLTALLAGEDTTANSLAWMIHLLTQHPEEQARLQQACDQTLGNASLWDNLDQADQLSFIDELMAETLRVKTVTPLIFLCANEDTQLGGISVSAGTDIILNMRKGANDSAHFENPESFRPGRWDGEQKRYPSRPPMAFGGGPRMCPGRSLATMEFRSVASMLIRNFTVTATDSDAVTERMAFTMVPDNLRVQFHNRTASSS